MGLKAHETQDCPCSDNRAKNLRTMEVCFDYLDHQYNSPKWLVCVSYTAPVNHITDMPSHLCGQLGAKLSS